MANDTIAACATGLARAAIGVLRLSGPDALAIASQVFPVKKAVPRRLRFGAFYVDGARVDEGLFVYMPGPSSYTGEDTVELYCHGSPGLIALLLDALYRAGARPAQPGEFTRRAFENGKLDLAQAEAVVDLIDSETRAAARNAAAQLSGALGKRLSPVRDSLIGLAAHFSAVIDYPDDDIPEFFTEDAVKTLRDAADALQKLLSSVREGGLLRDGVTCVLAGAPNVGKSSLLNALSGEDRAIVTPIPGTTRDVIDTRVVWEGIAVRLLDTAGLRESDDPIEREGVARTERAMKDASLILAVFDGSRESLERPEVPPETPVIAVVNKCDLPPRLPAPPYETVVRVSAATGEGIPVLKDAMIAALRLTDIASDGSTVTNPRQASALSRALACVGSAERALISGVTPDAVMTEVEDAAAILGEITGESASEDILATIFSRFCVGK
ncbi:MAG: tRNA uridine-5-carboxymethylaminomethyl(34) synthesis GTPase MnmE [Clostridiaceae bacterium]|nr:tRNA uridine-5-carboxymethylaminomethyl(34) synthesis GTPase MnmE [Clostridiaceae bacterium]